MRSFALRHQYFLACALALVLSPAAADTVLTVRDKRIEGLIVYEDESRVTLRTENYGELTFRKLDLKSITRSAQSAPIVRAATPTINAPARPTPTAARASAAPAPTGVAPANPFEASAPTTGGGNRFVSDRFPGSSPAAGTNPAEAGGVQFRPGEDPFARRPRSTPAPAATPTAPLVADPFAAPASSPAGGENPFGGRPASVGPSGGDPFASAPPPVAENPFDGPPTSVGPSGGDPFAAPPSPGGSASGSVPGMVDPFAPPAESKPVAAPAAAIPSGNPFEAAAVSPGAPVPTPPKGVPTMAPPASTSIPPAAGAVPTLDQMASRVTSPPEIKSGYDGAVFDINPPTKPVQIIPAEGADPVEESAQALVRVGARVKTMDSRAQLTLRGKADSLRIPTKSEIRLAKLSPNGEQVQIDVISGSLWTDVSPRVAVGDFKVVTPDLTAGVKGTRFRIDVLPNRGTMLSVDEGAVEVFSKNAPVSTTVRQFEAVIVAVNGQLSEAIKLDPAKSREGWEQWAAESAAQVTAGLPFGGDYARPLFDQIAADNARWSETMDEANRTIAENKYLDQMEQISSAFMRLAQDTGYVPEDSEAWNLLKENRLELAGWAGPYVEGAIPPADPWNNCLIYRKRVSQSGNVNAILYSRWRDQVDSNGQQPGDRFVIVPFYTIDRIKSDPRYAPRQ